MITNKRAKLHVSLATIEQTNHGSSFRKYFGKLSHMQAYHNYIENVFGIIEIGMQKLLNHALYVPTLINFMTS